MEAFSITCTTCKSRLKVRSAAAIGQVVSCPKCGGMVLIKSPEDVPPEIANAATKPVEQQGEPAREHNTKDFDDIDSILAGAAPVPTAAVSRGEQPARGNDKLPLPAAPAAMAPKDAAPPPATTMAATEPAAATAPAPHRVGRYGLWLAISILAGVTMAFSVVIAGSLLRGGGNTVASKPTVPPATLKGGAVNPAKIEGDTQSGKVTPPLTNIVSPPGENAKSKEQPAATKNDNDAAPQPPAPEPPAAKQDDPLGIAEPPKAASNSDKAAATIGDDPLGKFSAALGGGNDDPLPAAEASAASDKPVVDLPPEAAAKPTAPRPPPRHVDVAARLAEPLPGIDVPGVPLADFLEVMSGLSTIPITLRPEGLPLAALTPATPVSLKAENTTVGQALTAALSPLHLEYTERQGQLIVSLLSKLNERSFRIDDLTHRREGEAQELAEWATALVDPAVWTEGEEEGATLTPGIDQFAVRASDQTYADLLLLFEKLRVARGLPLQSKRDAELFRLESRTAKARAKLATPITLNFGQPALLVRILDRLEEDAKVRILVDWQALGAEEWNPDGEGTLSVENKPLSEALSELLTPMDLAWRAIDEQTIQVTSLAAFNQIPELEFHPAGELAADAAAGEALLARLRSTLAAAGKEEVAHELRFDLASRCILASLPQPQQRHVEKLLGEWAAAGK